jgi:hypothetical protein
LHAKKGRKEGNKETKSFAGKWVKKVQCIQDMTGVLLFPCCDEPELAGRLLISSHHLSDFSDDI